MTDTNLLTAHPGAHARLRPDHPAVVMVGSGAKLTYGELEARSNRLAHLLRSRGLRPGDHLAVLLPNDHHYFEVVWAGLRSGLYVTPINWHLGPEEAGYIISDCEATALVTSSALAPVLSHLGASLARVHTRLSTDAGLEGFEVLDDATAGSSDIPAEDETEGAFMFYSSGTTGRPKGIKPALTGVPFGTGGTLDGLLRGMYGFDSETRYLCPAPLYHAAPIGWSTAVQRIGGTVHVMERFDATDALAAIAHHRITEAQFVPTHFVRMLKLPAEVRSSADTSSLRTAIHAAAPCPVEVKRAMLDWWGPVIHEYYAGSEGNGFCAIGPAEWLDHPGSVGRPLVGTVHVVGEDGVEVPAGQTGQIWFESGARFEYHNDPAKTASAFDSHGWSSLGDVGHVDSDGYVFLTDRASHMIISGGVNIYPQEIENLLTVHPEVSDVAVIGVPDEEMGEQVKAVVVAADPARAGEALADELIAHCRAHLAGYKCPRSVDFVADLPRLPTGKLLKRTLRDRYATSDQGAGPS